ncbi:MAG TPA: energy transducer TonB [Opitutaceae bacterium]|jgi:TonB family protein
MNCRNLLFICAALLPSIPAVAALPNVPDYTPLGVDQTQEAVYPTRLIPLGVKSGTASVAVAVDDQGHISDYLVTAYSHPAFADAAVAAIKKWKFEPVRVHGYPRNSKSDFTFRFQLEGVVVVTMTDLSFNEMLDLKLIPGSMAYRACSLSELDRIPTPTKVVRPEHVHLDRPTRIAVSFYIDENGDVRMPSVSMETNEAHQALSALAVSTISQWKFETPTSKGKPVLVVAQQNFDFMPMSPQQAASGTP